MITIFLEKEKLLKLLWGRERGRERTFELEENNLKSKP